VAVPRAFPAKDPSLKHNLLNSPLDCGALRNLQIESQVAAPMLPWGSELDSEELIQNLLNRARGSLLLRWTGAAMAGGGFRPVGAAKTVVGTPLRGIDQVLVGIDNFPKALGRIRVLGVAVGMPAKSH